MSEETETHRGERVSTWLPRRARAGRRDSGEGDQDSQLHISLAHLCPNSRLLCYKHSRGACPTKPAEKEPTLGTAGLGALCCPSY